MILPKILSPNVSLISWIAISSAASGSRCNRKRDMKTQWLSMLPFFFLAFFDHTSRISFWSTGFYTPSFALFLSFHCCSRAPVKLKEESKLRQNYTDSLWQKELELEKTEKGRKKYIKNGWEGKHTLLFFTPFSFQVHSCFLYFSCFFCTCRNLEKRAWE